MSTLPPGDQGDDLSQDIFSRTDYAANQPPPKQFKPWHLPRKQFVRREQWITQARKAFEGRDDQAPVAYLGLPGVDLLDLRYLHQQLCIPLGRRLRYLGFNSEAATNESARVDLHTSLDEVSRLGNVDPQSDVIRDDFRGLARTDSIAYKKARTLGPFDVVNLDLCDGIAGDDPASQTTLYTAIAALIALQVRRPHPWTLLITSRIGRDHFHADALQALLSYYNTNIASCEKFAKACAELLGAEDPAEIDPATCQEPLFLRVAIVALCNWLLALGQSQSPNHVRMASCLGYRVNRGAPCEDLVSIALIFRPVITPPADALAAGPATPVDQCAEATQIARRASHLGDVDAILDSDAALTDELIGEMADLLKSARYNPDEYKSWLAQPSSV